MSAELSIPDSSNQGNPPTEPLTEFYCTYCRARRECITCWHGRMLREANAAADSEEAGRE